MKKFLLLTAIIFLYQYAFCQAVLPKLVNDTLYTTCGYKLVVGQKFKLGVGTKDNGDFKFIAASHGIVPDPRQVALRRSFNHHTATVKKIRQDGNKTDGYLYMLIIGTGDIVNYECDIEKAIAAGEITVPDDCKMKLNRSTNQPLSVADEIAKLKKLYDDGVITKEEFEAQKKKLIEGN